MLIDRQSLMTIAQMIVDNSDGRARLAFQEDDQTNAKVEDAAHFIKVDGKRVGRDIEMYGFFGDGPMGWEQALATVLEEILMPVKALDLSKSYAIAGNALKELGHQVYKPELIPQWDELF